MTAIKKLSTKEIIKLRPKPEELQKLERFPAFFLLDNVRSLDNVGLTFRLADALRVKKLYLCGITGYPDLGEKDPRRPNIKTRAQRKIEKTAVATFGYVPFEYRESAIEVIKELKQQKVQIVCLEQTTASKNYLEADYQFPLCVVAGHEREGVDDEILELADLIVEIPMYGIGNSLNVSHALAIIGYELARKIVTATNFLTAI